jgi:hypothetical protein
MTADRTTRLREIGAVLAERMPSVLDAMITLLESIPPAVGPPRPERYEITRQIGAGGQAEVLLATIRGAEEFHRLVAVKRVRSDQVNAARAVVDLINEAHVTSRLSHPNVVGVLDVDHDKAGQPFLVMEYVDGSQPEPRRPRGRAAVRVGGRPGRQPVWACANCEFAEPCQTTGGPS